MADQHRPLVSVVIPAYNAEQYIDEALRSVLAQTYERIEIIVVDDGSTDSTGARAAAYGHRVQYIRQSNSGGYPGIPRNVGISRANGDCICFLDADDIMLPDRVRVQAEFLQAHPDVGCVFGDYRDFSARDPAGQAHFRTCPRLSRKLLDASQLILSSADATALLLWENVGLPSSMAISRNALKRVPGFPTDLRIGEDFHFCYRVSRQLKLGVINSVVSLRRLHESNITRDSLRTLLDYVASYSSLRNSESNAVNAARLDEMLHQCETGLARAYANQRQYRRALVHSLRSLRGASPRHLGRVIGSARSMLRTAAIAARLKEPGP